MNPSSSTPSHNGTTQESSGNEKAPSAHSLKNDEFPQWTTLKFSPLKPVNFDEIDDGPIASFAANARTRTTNSKLTTLDWGNFTEPRAEMVWKVDELRIKKFQRTGVYEGPSHDLMDFTKLRLGWVEQKKKFEEKKKREARIPQGMHHKLRSRRERDHLANVDREENKSDATSDEDWVQETRSKMDAKKRVQPRTSGEHHYRDLKEADSEDYT